MTPAQPKRTGPIGNDEANAGPTTAEFVKFANTSHNHCNGTGIQGYTNGEAIICPCAIKGWKYNNPIEASKLKGHFERTLGGRFEERKPTHGGKRKKTKKRRKR